MTGRILAGVAAFVLSTPLAIAGGDTMRAIRMHERGGPEVLRLERVPIPVPAAGEVRLRVVAAGVNPIDWKIREGAYGRPKKPFDEPRIPGFDVAGTIDVLGEGVKGYRAGDAVIASLQNAKQGGYAEYVVVSADDIAPKPKTWTFEQAAGLPTVGVTTWRFLIEQGALAKGERVLVQGGAGGVGSIGVQVAKARGAHVIATASAGNFDYLKSIGADELIDYTAGPFEARVAPPVDLVFDTVGGEVAKRSIAVVRPGGRLVTIAALPDAAACAAAQIRCVGATPRAGAFGPELRQVVTLADEGRLTLNVERVFPLEEAAAAQELNRAGHTRGKIVIRVAP